MHLYRNMKAATDASFDLSPSEVYFLFEKAAIATSPQRRAPNLSPEVP
jgi:hypothetical protein